MLKQYLTNKLLGGVLFGLGAVLVFGAYLWVQAQVAPSTITNPTFGPQDQDVTINQGAFPAFPLKVCRRGVAPSWDDYFIVGPDWTTCPSNGVPGDLAQKLCLYRDRLDGNNPSDCGW